MVSRRTSANTARLAIFDAALGEFDWATAVDLWAEAAGVDGFAIADGNIADPAGFAITSGGYDMERFYDAGYTHAEIFDTATNEALEPVITLPTCRLQPFTKLVTERQHQSGFFQTVIQGVTDPRAHRFYKTDRMLVCGLVTASREDYMTQVEEAKVAEACDALGQAYGLRERVRRQNDMIRNLSDLIDRFGRAVVLLDCDGRILRDNQEFANLVRQNDGISARNGSLSFFDRAAERWLQKALAKGGYGQSEPMIALRPSGVSPYRLLAFPAVGIAGMPGHGSVRLKLVIEDLLSQNPAPDPTVLVHWFGLTRAEAEVARLVPVFGARRAIASHLGLSENTVKTHLASIREKTGADNMVDLTSVLMRAGLR